MVARRGRSVYEGVLRIFTVDPRHNDLFENRSPELPEVAIRAALAWFVKAGDQTLDRRIERTIRRLGGSPDAAAETVLRLATDHYRRALLRPNKTVNYRSIFWGMGDRREVDDLAALMVASFFGDEEIGADRIADAVIAQVYRRSNISKEEIHRAGETFKSNCARLELAGKEIFKSETRLTSNETVDRLDDISINQICEVRDKLALVAEMGYLYIHGAGHGESMGKRILDASTSSFGANALLHMTIPIADTLTGSAWHRISALLLMILTETGEGYADTLDKLAIATLPDR